MESQQTYETLNQRQRLKAACHYTTKKLCQEVEEDRNVSFNSLLVAAISEAAWKKCEQFANDLELFSKHAKRTTINADDIKLLVRKSPKLYQHITGLHEQIVANKPAPKKKPAAKKTKSSAISESATTSTSHVTDIDMDEDSRS